MAAKTKASVKSFFETRDKPVESQFADLIDSYQDHHGILQSIGTAAASSENTGFLEILGTSEATIRSAASTRAALGSGTVGDILFLVETTAAARDQLAITSATDATASTASFGLVRLATTAETITGDKIDRVMTPAAGRPRVVQVVSTQTGAVATGTTATPHDDTIPQITEGDEYMTLSITPKDTNNTLIIEVVAVHAHSASLSATVALFQDSTANAIAAVTDVLPGADQEVPTAFTHIMTAGITSATTFKVRIGSATGATTTFNGFNAGRGLGGVMASSITIWEVRP